MILVGTSDGLYELDGGPARRIIDGEIRATGGGWVIAGRDIVSLGTGRRVGLDGPSPECVVPVDGGALVGTAEARLFRVSAADWTVGPVRGFDAIPTRDEWYTPWGAPPDTRCLSVGADGDWLVNVHVGGVWRSADSGESWTEIVPPGKDVHQVIADGGSVIAAAAAGFGRSDDGGANWSWSTAGLHADYCRAVAAAEGHELVTASTGPGTRRGALYRRPAGSAEPFERCMAGLPDWFGYNLDTFQLAADGAVVLLGTREGNLYVSEDSGSTFSTLMTDLPAVRCVAIDV
ncbi:MAG TPA: hypothetical protein VFO41_11450 [Alphaproteobacteria bacterium]|nr:hypothetical protein [Alphaproteobacteria bacterium]